MGTSYGGTISPWSRSRIVCLGTRSYTEYKYDDLPTGISTRLHAVTAGTLVSHSATGTCSTELHESYYPARRDWVAILNTGTIERISKTDYYARFQPEDITETAAATRPNGAVTARSGGGKNCQGYGAHARREQKDKIFTVCMRQTSSR